MVRRRTSARKKRSTAYTGLGTSPAKRSGIWVLLVLGVLVVVNLYVFVWDKKTGVRAIKQQAEAADHPVPMTVPTQPLAPSRSDAQPADAPRGAVGSIARSLARAAPAAIEGKVAKSDTLGKLLKRNGLTAAETDEVIHALSGVLDFKTIKAGESFRIERGTDNRVVRFELDLAKGRRVLAERKPTGELAGTAI
jgi:hypothetical protein